MFTTFVRRVAPCGVLAVAALMTGSAHAGGLADWAARMEKRIDLNLYQVGRDTQFGRECGITDDRMPGHLDDYRALEDANDAALRSTTLSKSERETLGPFSDAHAAFDEGGKAASRARLFFPKGFGCEERLKGWAKEDQERAVQARKWRELADRLKAGGKP